MKATILIEAMMFAAADKLNRPWAMPGELLLASRKRILTISNEQ